MPSSIDKSSSSSKTFSAKKMASLAATKMGGVLKKALTSSSSLQRENDFQAMGNAYKEGGLGGYNKDLSPHYEQRGNRYEGYEDVKVPFVHTTRTGEMRIASPQYDTNNRNAHSVGPAIDMAKLDSQAIAAFGREYGSSVAKDLRNAKVEYDASNPQHDLSSYSYSEGALSHSSFPSSSASSTYTSSSGDTRYSMDAMSMGSRTSYSPSEYGGNDSLANEPLLQRPSSSRLSQYQKPDPFATQGSSFYSNEALGHSAPELPRPARQEVYQNHQFSQSAPELGTAQRKTFGDLFRSKKTIQARADKKAADQLINQTIGRTGFPQSASTVSFTKKNTMNVSGGDYRFTGDEGHTSFNTSLGVKGGKVYLVVAHHPETYERAESYTMHDKAIYPKNITEEFTAAVRKKYGDEVADQLQDYKKTGQLPRG